MFLAMDLTTLIFLIVLLVIALVYIITKIVKSNRVPLVELASDEGTEDDCEIVAAIMAAVSVMYQNETGRQPKLSFKIKRRD